MNFLNQVKSVCTALLVKAQYLPLLMPEMFLFGKCNNNYKK